MENIKDISLRKALEVSGCLELPKSKSVDDFGFWIRAIVLVRKRDYSQSYALAERRGDGCIIYTHDFGAMSPITGLLSIHPYLYLDERLMPSVDSARYLSVLSHELCIDKNELGGYDSARLLSCAREVAIRRQKVKIETDAYADEISRVMDEDSRVGSEFSVDDNSLDEVVSQSKPDNIENDEEIVVTPKRRGRKKQ